MMANSYVWAKTVDEEIVDRLAETLCDRGATLLEAVRTDGDVEPVLAALASCATEELRILREDRSIALAFWINVYNATSQLLIRARPNAHQSTLGLLRFFRTPVLTLDGTQLTLDDIEHGILRGSRSKYGLGYLPRIRPTRFERRYRLADPDPRVHFALNCGAVSCPAIRAYTPDHIDDQLALAAKSYLEQTVAYRDEATVVRVPRLFLYYYGDFGGQSGTRDVLRSADIIPEDRTPRIRYDAWDWTPQPGKFVE